MKKHLLVIVAGLIINSLALGQKIHAPAEILQIMEKSPVSYELQAIETKISTPDRSEVLNYNDYYRVKREDKILSYKYELKDEAKQYLEKAEEYFESQKYSLSREMYLKVLSIDSGYYKVMTYIGQTYGIEGDMDKAIEWYHKTIQRNYIDYMAHWFLADAYKSKGELDKAVDEITIANILNRNNPRIKVAMNKIYALKKLKTDDWTFTPQMKIDSAGTNKVSIAFDADWLGYAMVKALWLYEPGYRESMGVKRGSLTTLEEKECFLSLMTSFDKKKLKKYPEFKALQLSLDNKMLDEYIFYEIILLDHPFVSYQLPEAFISSIKDYVIQIRGKQK